jgi:hypothetical protein
MKFPKSFYNWLSISGFIIALNSLVLILVLFVLSLTTMSGNTYLGVFIYMVLPAFLIIGLLAIPAGMILVKSKRYEMEAMERWPKLDLNKKDHRSTFIKVSVITMFFLIASAMGSYQAFTYTESVEFCGLLCHKVMEPEHTTYMNSPHARVACVECHVGEGADWYVKSKMSGLYQVYSVIFNKYSRPIATPLENLRPARETCERCHWPEKFYSTKLRNERRYLADTNNTEWNVSLLMKIGPSHSAMGLKEGIHWHINKDFKIEYISTERNRETIPWVRLTNLKTGEVKIFEDEEAPLDAKAKDTLVVRAMDCMDCHNRPSHLYKSPVVYVDNAIVAGLIPNNIPFFKYTAMQALKLPFKDRIFAAKFIHDTIITMYKNDYPDVYAKESKRIESAIKVVQTEYSKNAFPEMGVESRQYLNHIGHLESMGCFRCHSDKHKTKKGEVIKKDCNLCHSIIAQGPTGKMTYSSLDSTLEFLHPIKLKNDAWKTGFCSECHKNLFE